MMAILELLAALFPGALVGTILIWGAVLGAWGWRRFRRRGEGEPEPIPQLGPYEPYQPFPVPEEVGGQTFPRIELDVARKKLVGLIEVDEPNPTFVSPDAFFREVLSQLEKLAHLFSDYPHRPKPPTLDPLPASDEPNR